MTVACPSLCWLRDLCCLLGLVDMAGLHIKQCLWLKLDLVAVLAKILPYLLHLLVVVVGLGRILLLLLLAGFVDLFLLLLSFIVVDLLD